MSKWFIIPLHPHLQPATYHLRTLVKMLWGRLMYMLTLLSITLCLFYCLLQVIRSNGASDASILLSLAGCAFYGIVISSYLFQRDDQLQGADPVVNLPAHTLTERPANSSSCCPICLEKFEAGDQISYGQQCRHAFHTGCIRNWTVHSQRNDCPCCREPLFVPNNNRRRWQGPFGELFRAR